MTAKRILLVDDEPGLRTMLAANLELDGFEVIEADGAAAALELARTQHFDLMLSDIRMPGMNGVELFRALRQRGQSLQVVLMTGFALEELVTSALEEGAFAVLPKPFDVAQALQAIHRAAKRPAVLVIDDSRGEAATTCAALQACGVAARAAYSGEEALVVLGQGDTDAWVVDLVMPAMSGAELARRARAVDPALAIIAVSGHEVPELVREVAAAGMHSFFRKPFPARSLARHIGLARARGATGLPVRRKES